MKWAPARSLVWQLSAWSAVQSLMGLTLVAMGVYLATAWSLSIREQETLEQRQAVVEHLVKEAVCDADPVTLRHKLNDFFVGTADMGLRLELPDGKPLYERAIQGSHGHTRTARFEQPWPLASQGSIRGLLTLDTSLDDGLLDRLAAILVVSALAGAALISLTGSVLVRRSLMPVLALSCQIRSIEPAGLHGRLDGAGQPEELQPVVQQFNALLQRLEQAYAQLEAFNADVAHELRTPLTALIGHSEVALSRPRSAPELQEVIGNNLDDLRRLAGIVNDMLFLSKADRGARARRAPIPSVAELVNEVVEFHDAALQDAGLQSHVTGDAAGAFDTALLRRALSNLLGNATRYASPHTAVDVEIAMPSPDVLQLVVSNQGQDIGPEHLPRLFDRFYRAEASREHGDLNHGLGLAIVAAIARMHGGQAFADSRSGRTSIGLCLPATDAHADQGHCRAGHVPGRRTDAIDGHNFSSSATPKTPS